MLRPSKEKLCFPALPFLLPRIGSFRVVTGTQGVDLYGLTYESYCMRDGVAQRTARALDSIGINATSTDPLTPNAPLLRGAEAIDSIGNAILSAKETTRAGTAGRILCSITETGGVIYTLIITIMALTFLTLLPIVNFCVQFCFNCCQVLNSGAARRTAARGARASAQKAGGKAALAIQNVPLRMGRRRRVAPTSGAIGGLVEAFQRRVSATKLEREPLTKEPDDAWFFKRAERIPI